VAGKNVLPEEIVEEIVEEIIERTDGIPLFVKELTKAVVEARVGDGDEASTLNRVPPSALAIPATLHASLMARLDGLVAVAREVAQISAATGREFSYEVLAPADKFDRERYILLLRHFWSAIMVVLRYHPKNMGDVHLGLRGVDDNVVVECGTDVKLEDVYTVADLRALRKWPSFHVATKILALCQAKLKRVLLLR
jgi:hypothetical protein